MTILEVGCCGAYCRTCKALKDAACKGCKFGYATGERDLERAKCQIKICCIRKGYNSCADCPDIMDCRVINDFYDKKGYKYKKYRQAVEYIRKSGYEKFQQKADSWTNAYGKY